MSNYETQLLWERQFDRNPHTCMVESTFVAHELLFGIDPIPISSSSLLTERSSIQEVNHGTVVKVGQYNLPGRFNFIWMGTVESLGAAGWRRFEYKWDAENPDYDFLQFAMPTAVEWEKYRPDPQPEDQESIIELPINWSYQKRQHIEKGWDQGFRAYQRNIIFNMLKAASKAREKSMRKE